MFYHYLILYLRFFIISNILRPARVLKHLFLSQKLRSVAMYPLPRFFCLIDIKARPQHFNEGTIVVCLAVRLDLQSCTFIDSVVDEKKLDSVAAFVLNPFYCWAAVYVC